MLAREGLALVVDEAQIEAIGDGVPNRVLGPNSPSKASAHPISSPGELCRQTIIRILSSSVEFKEQPYTLTIHRMGYGHSTIALIVSVLLGAQIIIAFRAKAQTIASSQVP